MELAQEMSKDQPIVRKTEPLISTDIWHQDQWSREDRPTIVNKVNYYYYYYSYYLYCFYFVDFAIQILNSKFQFKKLPLLQRHLKFIYFCNWYYTIKVENLFNIFFVILDYSYS